MAHYKAYFIGSDGHFVKAVDIIKDDDPTAIIAARALIGKHAIELWEGDRRILQFDLAKPVKTPGIQPEASP